MANISENSKIIIPVSAICGTILTLGIWTFSSFNTRVGAVESEIVSQKIEQVKIIEQHKRTNEILAEIKTELKKLNEKEN